MRDGHAARPPARPLLLLAAGLVAVLAACGSTTGGGPSPSPIGASPTPKAGYQVLVVRSPRSAAAFVVLYDSLTGASRTVPTDPMPALAQFATGGRISYWTVNGIVSELPDGSDRRTEVPGNVEAYAWRSDGALAYVAAVPPLNDREQLTIRVPGAQPVTADLGEIAAATGVNPARSVAFSPDGRLVLLVGMGTANQVRALDGSLRFGPWAGGGAAWGADGRLYAFTRTDGQVVDLTTHATTTLLPGVHGWNPAISPDGRSMVFEQRDPIASQPGGFGPPRLQLFDVAAGTIVSGFSRDNAVLAHFVAPAELWFSEMIDVSGGPIVDYDLVRYTERQTGLDGNLTGVQPAGTP